MSIIGCCAGLWPVSPIVASLFGTRRLENRWCRFRWNLARALQNPWRSDCGDDARGSHHGVCRQSRAPITRAVHPTAGQDRAVAGVFMRSFVFMAQFLSNTDLLPLSRQVNTCSTLRNDNLWLTDGKPARRPILAESGRRPARKAKSCVAGT